MSDDPLEELGKLEESEKPKPKRSSKADDFADPMTGVSRRDTEKITKKGEYVMHGNYQQVTFRLPPGWADRIAEIAEDLGTSQAETKRWLVAVGISEYRRGRRPETEEKVVRKRLEMPEVDG